MRKKDDNKISQIFDATLQLVERNGLTGINIADIARAADIAAGTVYIYFESKEALINALFTKCRTDSAAFYFSNVKKTDGVKDSFRKIFSNIIHYKINHFREAFFLEQCFHSPLVAEEKRKESFKFMKPFFNVIEEGKKQGLIKNIDCLHLFLFVAGGTGETAKGMRYARKCFSDEMIDTHFDLCWDAIRKKR